MTTPVPPRAATGTAKAGPVKVRKRASRAKETLDEVLGQQKPLVRRIAAAAFVIRLAPVLLPVVLKFTLSPILHHRAARLFGRNWTPEDLLLGLVISGIGVALIRGVANYRFVSLAGRCGHSLVADLRKVMFEHILRMPVSYVDRRGTGKILLRFIGDSDALRNWHSRTRPTVFADSALVIVLAAGMFWLHWQLALLVLLPLPFLAYAIRHLSAKLQMLTLRARQLQAEFTGHVQSRFDVIRQSKWLDADRKARQTTADLVDEVARQNVLRERYAAAVKSLGNLLSFLSIPILIWFGISLVWSGRLTTGSFVALIWLAAHMSVAVQRLSSAVVIRQKGRVSLQRISRLLERSAERGRSTKTRRLRVAGRSIQCVDLVFCDRGLGSVDSPLNAEWSGPQEHQLDPEIDIAAFCDVLLGFRRPKRGKVFVDGQALDDVRVTSVRSAVGWIPRSPAVFDGTVAENIQIARPSTDAKSLVDLVRSAGLIADEHVALWLSRRAGPGGRELTSREILGVALIRVLLRRPRFVLAEHPDHNLIRAVLQRTCDPTPLILFASPPDGERSMGQRSASMNDVEKEVIHENNSRPRARRQKMINESGLGWS